MSYVKQTWLTGDTITATKLNHMEDGIAGAGGGGTEYEAGDNIQIEGNVISATDTTYTAGEGISIQNGVISATGSGSAGVESVEGLNGQVRVRGGRDGRINKNMQDNALEVSTIYGGSLEQGGETTVYEYDYEGSTDHQHYDDEHYSVSMNADVNRNDLTDGAVSAVDLYVMDDEENEQHYEFESEGHWDNQNLYHIGSQYVNIDFYFGNQTPNFQVGFKEGARDYKWVKTCSIMAREIIKRPIDPSFIPIDRNTIQIQNGVLVAQGGSGSSVNVNAGSGIRVNRDQREGSTTYTIINELGGMEKGQEVGDGFALTWDSGNNRFNLASAPGLTANHEYYFLASKDGRDISSGYNGFHEGKLRVGEGELTISGSEAYITGVNSNWADNIRFYEANRRNIDLGYIKNDNSIRRSQSGLGVNCDYIAGNGLQAQSQGSQLAVRAVDNWGLKVAGGGIGLACERPGDYVDAEKDYVMVAHVDSNNHVSFRWVEYNPQ